MSSSQLEEYRKDLADAIKDEKDISSAIDGLMCAKVPLEEKFQVLNFCSLIEQNSESNDSLVQLRNALEILGNYGKNLLKPRKKRTKRWKIIKKSNSNFRDKIIPIKGGLHIIQLLGYTKSGPDGMEFPDGVNPDYNEVLKIVTDIILGQYELENYLTGRHPNPESIKIFISTHVSEEKNMVAGRMEGMKSKEECSAMAHDPDVVHHEYVIISEKYDAEVDTVEKLTTRKGGETQRKTEEKPCIEKMDSKELLQWRCKICSFKNYASVKVCRTCKTKKIEMKKEKRGEVSFTSTTGKFVENEKLGKYWFEETGGAASCTSESCEEDGKDGRESNTELVNQVLLKRRQQSSESRAVKECAKDLPKIAQDKDDRLNIFEHPQLLIRVDEGNKFCIIDSAMSQLVCIDVPLNIVSVCGQLRTGKSYLMNLLSNQQTGFEMGSTVKAVTKGIWALCKPHPTRTSEYLLFLDTEGLADTEQRNSDHDSKLFSLTMLLSSTLIYNCKEVLHQDHLEKLSFLTKMTDEVKVADESVLSSAESARALRLLTPTFILCIRDQFLEMTDDHGENITPDQYLENILMKGKESSTSRIKEAIKKYFTKRKCFVMVQPAAPNKLRKLENLDDKELDPDFLAQVTTLKQFIYGCTPKVMDSVTEVPVTGLEFESLATAYVRALETGNPMNFMKTTEEASNSHNTKLLDLISQHYGEMVDSIDLPVKKKIELQRTCMKLYSEECRRFRQMAYPYNSNRFEDTLMMIMDVIREDKMKENQKIVQEMLARVLRGLQTDMFRTTPKGTTLWSQFDSQTAGYDDDEKMTAFQNFNRDRNEYGDQRQHDLDLHRRLIEDRKVQLKLIRQERHTYRQKEEERMENNYTQRMTMQPVEEETANKINSKDTQEVEKKAQIVKAALDEMTLWTRLKVLVFGGNYK